MDKFPRVIIKTTPDCEAERIVHTCLQTALGFYQTNSFYVLPYFAKFSNTIFLPHLEFDSVAHYWEKIKEMELNFPLKIPVEIKDFILSQTLPATDKKITEELEKKWRKVENEFFDFLKILMPENLKYINEAEVNVCSTGSIASCKILEKKTGQKTICYVRKDGNIGNIAEMIITTILIPDVDELNISWEARETLVDFVLTKSSIAYLFPDYVPTIKSIKTIDSKLKKESEQYLYKLKIPQKQYLTLDGNKILLKGENIISKLSSTQTEILSQLLKSQGNLLTYEVLEKIIWGEAASSFSMYALNKQMQRLRNRLIELGAPAYCLYPARGTGYKLVNK